MNTDSVATTVGIALPADFPVSVYNEVHAKVAPLQPRYVDEYRHYGGAWNAVAFRFQAAADGDQAFLKAISRPSNVSQRYTEETALFTFFANGVAVLDSLAYGLYAIGAIADQRSFPLTAEDLRTIHLKRAGDTFVKCFPQDALGTALLAVASDSVQVDLREIRNALSHRASSTRTHQLHVGGSKPSSERWLLDHLQLRSGIQSLDTGSDTTSRYRESLSAALGRVLDAARAFVHTHL